MNRAMIAFRVAFLLFALLCGAREASAAASCFWVGGTGSYNDATHWSSSSGGSGSTCAATAGIPKNTGDIGTADASSGGGTLTVDIDLFNLQSLRFGGFTGTVTWVANSKSGSFTASPGITCNGAGTKTIALGSGTFTFSDNSNNATPFDASNGGGVCTITPGTSTLVYSGVGTQFQVFEGGGNSFGTVTFSANSGGGVVSINGSNTFATLNIGAPNNIYFPQSGTTTITNAFTWVGTQSAKISLAPNGLNSAVTTIVTASGSTIQWAGLHNIVNSGTQPTVTNSFDFGRNSATISSPSVGSGGKIIGG